MKEIEITKEINAKNYKPLISQMKKYYPFYLYLIPALVIVILFSYVPMYGIIIAFKDFKMARGILGSEWVGLAHFQKIFSDPYFYRVLFNTIKLSVLSLVTSFPVTIIFA